MIEIKDLLLKFGNLLLSEEVKKETIREIVSKNINFQIKKEDIKTKNGTVYLNIKPIYKNEIFIKKEKIFSEIKNLLQKKAPEKFL